MIRISQIDSDFSVYKNHIVILLGNGKNLKDLLELFDYYNIEVNCICDTNKNKWGTKVNGLKVISPIELKQLIENDNKSFTIQSTTKNIKRYNLEEINKLNINTIISYDEASKILHVIGFMKLYKLMPNNPLISYNKSNSKNKNLSNLINHILKNDITPPIFIVQPQKTGDMTMVDTLKTNNIPHYFTVHNPNFADQKLMKDTDNKIKITTAVRDPIAQNISNLYQNIKSANDYKSFLHFIKDEKDFFKNGGDAQRLFDIICSSKVINNKNFNIPTFMELFKENIIDLSAYPFDKEKGYSIIKEGNIEVFVYQLEHMNDIITEMSDWIGQTPFDEWEIANEASSKWIADSYKQAQKEITFSQEYFDRCYNDPWIQHFYSQEDIEKFKARWRPHIKE